MIVHHALSNLQTGGRSLQSYTDIHTPHNIHVLYHESMSTLAMMIAAYTVVLHTDWASTHNAAVATAAGIFIHYWRAH